MSEAFGWTLLYVNYDCVTYLKNKSLCCGVILRTKERVCRASCLGPGRRADPRVRGQHHHPDGPTTRPDPHAPRRRGPCPRVCTQADGRLKGQSTGEALFTAELELWAVDLVGLRVVRCDVSVVPQQGAEAGSGFSP